MVRICILLLTAFAMYANASTKPQVLATVSIWADMARAIGGDFIEVEMIVPIGSDPHLYESTPSDLRKVNRADLILVNGLTFEGWLEKLIRSSGGLARQVLLTEGIEPIYNPEFKNATDPHAWMDPNNGIVYAQNIARALATLDPAHADQYRTRLENYLGDLRAVDAYIRSAVERISPEKRVLITSHDAFHYYGRRYGLEVKSLLGTSTEADVPSGSFLEIARLIRERSIPAIFIESTINPKLMRQLSTENNTHIGGKLYADSLGEEGSAASTYTGMLRSNTEVITNALSGDGAETRTLSPKRPDTSRGLMIFAAALILILMFAAFFLLAKKPER